MAFWYKLGRKEKNQSKKKYIIGNDQKINNKTPMERGSNEEKKKNGSLALIKRENKRYIWSIHLSQRVCVCV